MPPFGLYSIPRHHLYGEPQRPRPVYNTTTFEDDQPAPAVKVIQKAAEAVNKLANGGSEKKQKGKKSNRLSAVVNDKQVSTPAPNSAKKRKTLSRDERNEDAPVSGKKRKRSKDHTIEASPAVASATLTDPTTPNGAWMQQLKKSMGDLRANVQKVEELTPKRDEPVRMKRKYTKRMDKTDDKTPKKKINTPVKSTPKSKPKSTKQPKAKKQRISKEKSKDLTPPRTTSSHENPSPYASPPKRTPIPLPLKQTPIPLPRKSSEKTNSAPRSHHDTTPFNGTPIAFNLSTIPKNTTTLSTPNLQNPFSTPSFPFTLPQSQSQTQNQPLFPTLPTPQRTTFISSLSIAFAQHTLLSLASAAHISVPAGALEGEYRLFCPRFAEGYVDESASGWRLDVVAVNGGGDGDGDGYHAQLHIPPGMSYTTTTPFHINANGTADLQEITLHLDLDLERESKTHSSKKKKTKKKKAGKISLVVLGGGCVLLRGERRVWLGKDKKGKEKRTDGRKKEGKEVLDVWGVRD